jgi:hypothetical protein
MPFGIASTNRKGEINQIKNVLFKKINFMVIYKEP